MGDTRRSRYKHALDAIRTIYFDNNCVYGARRMHEILKKDGFCIAYHTVQGICKRFGLLAISELTNSIYVPKPDKKYKKVGFSEKSTTKSMPTTINEIWVCDWTRFYVYFYDELKPVLVMETLK